MANKMIPEKVKQIFKKHHYALIGKPGKEHSSVQTCRWTKKSLIGEGACYKEKFYGIQSHKCCQMTPSNAFCQNRCLHCWRAVEYTAGNKFPLTSGLPIINKITKKDISSPKEIIDGCIREQKNLLLGFKGHKNVNMKKYWEAQEPDQFAISLSGEPTLYPKIGKLIEELRRRKKSSFLVTNGLLPEKLEKMYKKDQLPTQLYVSINAPNFELYKKIHRTTLNNKKAWKKFIKTLELLPKLKEKTRTVFRMNLVLGLNMSDENIKEYVDLIKKSKAQFLEIKGFMSVGFSRQRLGYDKMPKDEQMKNFVKRLEKSLQDNGLDYKLLDEHKTSRAYVLGNKKTGKKELKIKAEEV